MLDPVQLGVHVPMDREAVRHRERCFREAAGIALLAATDHPLDFAKLSGVNYLGRSATIILAG
jgi:hypothetical protein